MTTPQIPALPGCTPLGLSEGDPTAGHTLTPWIVERSRDGRAGTHIRGGELIPGAAVPPAVCRMSVRGHATTQANAALIVRAVNAHDALVELAKLVSDYKGLIPQALVNEACRALAKVRGDA